LRAIGGALGAEREVVIVPGNHDHLLAHAWLERRDRAGEAEPLGLESAVEVLPGDAVAAVAERLAPAPVRVAYPGLWLREDVYATHGHYGDRHTTVPMLERLSAGIMARVVGERDGGPHRAEDYEAELAPMYAWIDAVAAGGGVHLRRGGHDPSTRAWGALTDGRRGVRGRALAAGFPVAVAALNRLGLGPLSPDLSGEGLRRAGVLAFAQVLGRLGVTAPYAIFGHTHRAGPVPADDRAEWSAGGGTAIFNTGCWLHEPRFMGADPARSPYRPGFAVVVDDGAPPRLINLLD
jgi:hypothetical protein